MEMETGVRHVRRAEQARRVPMRDACVSGSLADMGWVLCSQAFERESWSSRMGGTPTRTCRSRNMANGRRDVTVEEGTA